MNTTATVDLICAVFICIMYARSFSDRNLSKSNRRLNLCLMLMIVSLLVDAGAYVLVGPAYPVAMRYFLNLLSFTATTVNTIAFTCYMEALFEEKTDVNPWYFRGLIIFESIWLLCTIYEFIAGHLVSYGESGFESINYTYPLYVTLMSLTTVVYLPVITWINRKKLGKGMAYLLILFFIVPLFSSFLYSVAGIDLAFALAAAMLVLVVEFVQKKHTQELKAEQEKKLQRALEEANSEMRRNDIITGIINGSKWTYDISAEDGIVAARYTEKSENRIGAGFIEGTDWLELVHPEDKERVTEAFYSCIRDRSGNSPYSVTFRMRDPEGNLHWVRSGGDVIRHADGTGEFFGISVDITDQMEKERQREQQLSEALRKADAASRAKTDFLFNMSHDIRTPMNAIIGFTNIAKREIDNREKALDSLEKVQLSSEILLNLINDVLDMSRIESGKAELHESKYELREAFDSFEPAMASLAAAKDIDLQFSIGEVRDRYIFVDGPRFDRVLINIISNAVKYTLPGGCVRVCAEQLEDTEPGRGNYRFTVKDNGIGMSEEFQQHMYEDFTREENSTSSGVQGTGLGLPLAKRLVDMMGGSISCVSRQGEGTTFTVDFPFRLQTEEDIAQGSAVAQEDAKTDLGGRRALLVEDNELNREIAAEILCDEGIEIETASNGQRAVDLLREKGAEYYDFILMDIQMPVMNGYEATKAIREMYPDMRTPVIALSANAFEEDKRKSLSAGMDGHVAKPVNVRELLGVLAKFL